MIHSFVEQVLISSSPSAAACDPVTFDPPTDTEAGTSLDVTLSTTTSGAHIFYTVNDDIPINPTHSGDNPTGSTVRIGSNSGVVHLTFFPGEVKDVAALAYKSGINDSVITTAEYFRSGGG